MIVGVVAGRALERPARVRNTALHVATTRRRHGDRDHAVAPEPSRGGQGPPPAACQPLAPSRGNGRVGAGLARRHGVPDAAPEALVTLRVLPRGNVAPAWRLAEKVDLKDLLGPPRPERDVSFAHICSQALGRDLATAGVHRDEAYAANWLLAQRGDRTGVRCPVPGRRVVRVPRVAAGNETLTATHVRPPLEEGGLPGRPDMVRHSFASEIVAATNDPALAKR